MKLGEHCIKAWSVNQAVIALSSGEAEFYGIVEGATNALGIAGMLKDFGVNLGVSVSTDSSAAKGIANRRGLGKLRHIKLSEPWVQDLVAKGRITIYKIDGSENSSDIDQAFRRGEDRSNLALLQSACGARQARNNA